jgi:hypothetical protein
VCVLWVGVDVGGFEMRNEEPGRLRTDESRTRDGAGWYVGTRAAGSQHKVQDAAAGMCRGGARPLLAQ